MNIHHRLSDALDRTTAAIFAVLAIGLIVVLTIAGFSLLAGLITIALIMLVVWMGSIGVLAGSIVIGALLKLTSQTLGDFIQIWSGSPTDSFTQFVDATGYVEMILFVFLIFFTIRFTASHFRSSTPSASTTTVRTTDD